MKRYMNQYGNHCAAQARTNSARSWCGGRRSARRQLGGRATTWAACAKQSKRLFSVRTAASCLVDTTYSRPIRPQSYTL